MREEKWGRRLRAAVAAWVIVSAMSSPLIGLYGFFSSFGLVVPATYASPGFLTSITIIVDMFVLTGLVMFMGLASGFLYVMILSSTPTERLFKMARVLLLLAWGSAVLSSGYYAAAVLLLVTAPVPLFKSIGRWIDRHFVQAVLATGLFFIFAVLSSPAWERSLWTEVTHRPQFTIALLNSLSPSGWFCAVIGAVAYMEAFVAFQQWWTRGKWLKEVAGEGDTAPTLVDRIWAIHVSLWRRLCERMGNSSHSA